MADGQFGQVPATHHDRHNCCKEKSRPSHLNQRVGLQVIFHNRIKRDEAKHSREHPEDANRAVFDGGQWTILKVETQARSSRRHGSR